MSVQWTKEQRRVIELRDRDILVSAAAGSGKTAVLVERILSRITDEEDPVDIDRLLIMTFTRAAAGEMRDRLRNALEQRLEEHPMDEHLQRQTTLIHGAQITTIHGFCTYVIQNYFHVLGLDPAYRVGDAGELTLLKTQVAGQVLEEAYEEGDPAFHRMVESFCGGKTDENLQELLLNLYEFLMSYPWPEDCLRDWEAAYQLETKEELAEAPWMQVLWNEAGKYLREGRELAGQNLEAALEPGGPYMYEKALESDLAFLEELSRIRDFDEMYRALEKPSWARLAPVKDERVSETLKDQVKGGREQVKTLVKKLKESYFPATAAEVLETMAHCRENIGVLTDLARRFEAAYSREKRKKNLLDFSDMEHFALDILVEKEGEELRMTQAAKELSLKYREVLVDEYQDSNLVQEMLTKAVSGWAKDVHNIFLVGDVKQSIYRFRLARPELFMEKFHRFAGEEEENQRIDLHRNFRSRPQVLSLVNYLFCQMMGEDLGGVEYDGDAALNPGAHFPEGAKEEWLKPEILLLDSEEEEVLEEAADTPREAEALAVAARIREMVGKNLIADGKGGYRPVGYGDIVILLRTLEGWADTFAQVLMQQGIPAYTASKTGYFSALEVVTVLNLLRVLDNPRQEIPLTGALRSPVVGLSVQELAQIRLIAEGASMDRCVKEYAERGEDEDLREKLVNFLDFLNKFREKVPYTPIHQFLLELLEETGYGDYAAALPGGQQRKANLHMLVEKAMDYEKTSYRGLFHFVRYIESLQKYKVDFGEVSLGAGEAVEIMSIHKSKGLEFPVVFVSGMGKAFNTQDLRAGLATHPSLGLGADAVYPEYRGKLPTLLKEVIRQQTKGENLGEELRVLYVALTRAKEKLILTGTLKQAGKRVESLYALTRRKETRLSYSGRESAACYWDWVLPALARHRDFAALFRERGLQAAGRHPLYDRGPDLVIRFVKGEELMFSQVRQEWEQRLLKEQILHPEHREENEELRKALEERFSFRYPYEAYGEIPVKVSVSELKRRQQQDKEAMDYYPREELVPLVPKFLAGEGEEIPAGAVRGTAYHRVMECLNYEEVSEEGQIQRQLETLVQKEKLSPREAAGVRPGDILAFAKSPLGQRMGEAAGKNLLWREQPFVLTRPAKELSSDWPAGEQVLVQGIIDAYFAEGEELVLVDYKTDRVRPGEESLLAGRYRVQLLSYKEALERLAGRRVKEVYLYSFGVGKAISVE